MQDIILSSLGDRSPQEALDDGMPAQQVWDAVCDTFDFPEKYHYLNRIKPQDM